jgi:hypothetical protein
MKSDSMGVPPGDHEKRRALLDEARRRLDWLKSYWSESPVIMHSRDLWADFLRKNHMPPDTPHAQPVTSAEKELWSGLSHELSAQLGEQARILRQAYVDERSALVRNATPLEAASYVERTSACPPAATTTSGTKAPKYGQAGQSLEQLWPKQ